MQGQVNNFLYREIRKNPDGSFGISYNSVCLRAFIGWGEFIKEKMQLFLVTCVFFIGTQSHAPNFFPVFFLSPGYALPVVGLFKVRRWHFLACPVTS